MAQIDIAKNNNSHRLSEFGIRTDTSSRGVDLAGAKVTVVYTDGSSETLTWVAHDPYTFGGVSGEHVEMSFGFDWHQLKTTKPLQSFEIDLTDASSVFDTTLAADGEPDDPSTPGSKQGFPFRLSPTSEDPGGVIQVAYGRPAGLDGNDPVGDLYTTMRVDFSGLPEGSFQGTLSWNSDIDTLTGPFAPALDATDDVVTVSGDGHEQIDVLDNDVSDLADALRITHINDISVAAGETVTLESGEVVALNSDGSLSISNDTLTTETNQFSYTVADEKGNSDTGLVTVTTTPLAPPCFVAGTMIATLYGAVAIEDLRVGMLIVTRDNGLQPLRWIGRSARLALGRDAPVVFEAGALGHHRRIELSQNHRVLIRSGLAELQFGEKEVLVKAKHLINDETIWLRSDGRPVTYLHLLFDRHEILRGNGLESESYHPGDETFDAFDAETRAEILDLMPECLAYGPTARMALKAHESDLLCLNI